MSRGLYVPASMLEKQVLDQRINETSLAKKIDRQKNEGSFWNKEEMKKKV